MTLNLRRAAHCFALVLLGAAPALAQSAVPAPPAGEAAPSTPPTAEFPASDPATPTEPVAEPPGPAAPPGPTSAPTTPTASEQATPSAPVAEPKRKDKRKKHKQDKRARREQEAALGTLRSGRFGTLEPTGRLFVRATLARHHETVIDTRGATRETRIDSFDLSIPSARAGLMYHAPVRWLSANVELELTDKPELKDAWLRGRFPYLNVKAGQFKLPFSAVEMESAWSLPTASRGLLHDTLVKELQVAGRRPGLTVEAHGRGKIRPSLTLGAFQASVLVDDDPDKRKVELLSNQSLYSQSFVARAALEVHDWAFGLDYEDRIGTPALLATKHYSTGGADVTLDTDVRGLGLRIWAEGMVGASWLENFYKPPDDEDTLFWATRLVMAVRFGGRHRLDPYIEPYGMLGLLDPDTEVKQDLASEEALGVNVGLWKLARVGLELELEHVERNFPQNYYLGDDPDRAALVVQAAAEF